MNIKAICFDADGVVVYPQMQFSIFLAENYRITPEMTLPFFNGMMEECLLGRRSLEDLLPPYLQVWGWPGTLREFIQTWYDQDNCVDRRLTAAIQTLRKQGIQCCLATSQECGRALYMREVMGFHNIFDALFISCEIGCKKPDPAFFRHIQKHLGLDGGTLLFLDDRPENVEAARKFGWNAELYTDFPAFEAFLADTLR